VLFPLLGAIVNGLFGRGSSTKNWGMGRTTVHLVACLSVAASFLLALFSFIKLHGMHHGLAEGSEGANVALSFTAYEWFSIGVAGKTVPVQVRFLMDALSGVMTLVVTGIGLLIHIYSTGYMSEEKSYSRFFAYLNLFTAAMLILVLGSNLPLMFVGWEGVGLCSYLLIGFWYENPAYAAAGRKAFVVNRIGDFGVLVATFILVGAAHSFEFADINALASKLTGPLLLSGMPVGTLSIATAATLFLFLGCTGKSAQLPLYVWLPDAMAGPTPVSALIHAATMVTSGLYMICRLSPVFAVAPSTMAIIAVTGALTALLAATIGCVQNDIKKVLAYSTVSQLGFMFAAAGCGAFAASFFHVYTHAFFKACLFLGAGSVMHAVGAHGDADIRRLGGLRKLLPRTHITFLVSCLAIAGVPMFSGFFSKDEVLVGALSVGDYLPAGLGHLVFAMLVAAATMTAFYMFRLYFLTFAGEYRGGPEHAHGDHAHDEHGHGAPHESPDSMTIPLLILGAGAVLAGYVWIGLLHFEPWVHWLKPALGSIKAEHHGALVALAGGSAAALIGIGLAYAWYGKPGVQAPRILAEQFPRLHAFVFDKWRVDEFYEATVLALSRGVGMISAGVDKVVVDGLLTRVTALFVQGAGFLGTRLQNGLVQSYGAVMAAGLLGVAFWFSVPHVEFDLAKPSEGKAVELVAQAGLGYEYRWDFDSNGEYETAWGAETQASHDFADTEFEPVVVLVLEPGVYAAGLQRTRLHASEQHRFEAEDLGPGWQRGEDNDLLPWAEATAEGLMLHTGGARVHKAGKLLPAGEDVPLARGEHVDVGRARLTVTGSVRITAQIRNAFGAERTDSLRIELPEVSARPAIEVVGVAEATP
jgi:NADH-quinone oxidoreductase subunit L